MLYIIFAAFEMTLCIWNYYPQLFVKGIVFKYQEDGLLQEVIQYQLVVLVVLVVLILTGDNKLANIGANEAKHAVNRNISIFK